MLRCRRTDDDKYSRENSPFRSAFIATRTNMARFYPLYVRRSDGKLELVSKGKRKELNQPTDEQLDQKPDRDGISDFYREVALEEPKHLDWRRKLGGMLARELDWKDKSGSGMYVLVLQHALPMMVLIHLADNGYILVSFPENFRLYEHVKKTEKDGKTEVKNKTHAAGGNDRQDAYLYGHPDGRRKRFRSPNDFFPHLLWLCTDESGDPDNCTCKICSPEDLETVLPGAKLKMAERPIKQEQHVTSMARQLSAQNIKQEPGTPPIPRPMSGAPLQKKPTPLPLQPTPLPLPKSDDQKLDRRYHTFMYRPGEQVWFKRGAAWGLGVILRRWIPQSVSNASNPYYYLVQPLSYPGHNQSQVVKSSDSEMRPWLAWSVPRFTNDGLNNLPNPLRYENADWQGMMQRRYGNGDMEVDGSIMSAKTVDSTYTLFGPNNNVEHEAGIRETHYDGMFLGAEKVWVGDPIRLHIGTGTDVMVVHSIIGSKRVSAMNPKQVLEQSCKLMGDIYALTSVQHTNTQIPSPAAPNSNPHLPQRLTEDLAFRNARSIPTKRTAHYWKLVSAQYRVDLSEVKGRWYEASIVLPILQPQVFDEASRRGEIQESSLWMNSRGDCVNSNRPPNLPRLPKLNVRTETRKDAFGRSVPPGVEIREGIAPPLPENVDPDLEGQAGKSGGGGGGGGESNITASTAMDIDPRFDTADDGAGEQHDAGVGGLEEFMNLDGIDHDQLSGFGQDFGGGGGQQSPFF